MNGNFMLGVCIYGSYAANEYANQYALVNDAGSIGGILSL